VPIIKSLIDALVLIAQAPTASPAPSAQSQALRHVRLDAPLRTLDLIVTNDDQTNAVRCNFALTGDIGRITLYPKPTIASLSGPRTDVMREIAFVAEHGIVTALAPVLPPNNVSGGPPGVGGPQVLASVVIELAPGALLHSGIVPGTALRVPPLSTLPPSTIQPPCLRSIR